MRVRVRAKALANRWVWLFIRGQYVKGRFPVKSFRYGPVKGREALVLMCLWNRPTRIRNILDLLNSQDHPDGVRLFLWNNNRRDRDAYVSALREYDADDGALRRVDFVTSPINFGPISRFFWARKIAVTRPEVPVIVVDDDENFTSSFVRETLAQFDPGAVKGWWAWTVRESYWDRTPAGVGDRVDYVGTGGSVCAAGMFADEAFFTGIPDEFRFLDDIWLNYCATQQGYRLEKLEADISFVMDETNQFHGQIHLKSRFFDLLYGPKG